MKLLSSILVLVGVATAVASAQVTGDFKVTGSSYQNDVATISGTVNRGAIQSGKSVRVDITYTYSFVAQKTVTIPGETVTTTIFVPGKCVGAPASDNDCYIQNGPNAGKPKGAPSDAIWVGTYVTSTTTTEPKTITYTFNSDAGMTAITEPTVDSKGRLNPKGKITGYNWMNTASIVATPEMVDPKLVPEGYEVISATINSISYSAYLIDPSGVQIPDTVMSGTLPVGE